MTSQIGRSEVVIDAEIVEGEIVDAVDLPRHRERNAERALARIADASSDQQVEFLGALPPAEQAAAVGELITYSHNALIAAMCAHDLPGISLARQGAGWLQDTAKRLELSRELQDDAAVNVRRHERALGVAIREGQARGEILTKGKKNNPGNRWGTSPSLPESSRPTPTDYAKSSELFGGNGPQEGIYAMTDGVTDEQFDEALTEARTEGNLSRANVARKARAKAHPPADPKPEPEPSAPAPQQPERAPANIRGRAQLISSTEMLRNIAASLGGIASTCQYVNPAEVDAEEIAATLDVIRNHVKVINRTIKGIGAQQ